MTTAPKPVDVADSIAETLHKFGYKLTDEQHTILAGELAVWLEESNHAGFIEGQQSPE